MKQIELAKKYISSKKYDKALEILNDIPIEEMDSETKVIIGECLFELEDYSSASNYFIDYLIENYDKNIALKLEKIFLLEKNEEALLGLKIMINEHNPEDIYTLREITTLAQKTQHYDIASQYFEIILKKCPSDYVAWNNYGLVYEKLDNYEKACECYEKSLKNKDFFDANYNLGVLLRKTHQLDKSVYYLKKASQQNNTSKVKYSLAMSYLMNKDYQNGYTLLSKYTTEIMRKYYHNEWDGKKYPASTLCIFATGGLGDMIMYSRYIEYVKDYFKKIIIALPKTLHSIFKNSFPYLEIIDLKTDFAEYDYAITLLQLMKIFNLDFNKIVPNTSKYLVTDENLIKKFKVKYFNNEKLKIGINWHGSSNITRTFLNRSMPIENFEPLFDKMKDKAIFYSI